MIYIWHNQDSGLYQMGDYSTYVLERGRHNVTLLYDFIEDELIIAKKILLNLNRASKNFEVKVA